MIKNLLLVLFTFLSLSTFGQLAFEPDMLQFTADTTEQRAEFHFTITNTRQTPIEFWWNIDRGNSPEDWVFAVCDINQCYVDGLEACPCSIPNVLAGGESFEYSFYLISNGVIASSDVTFNVTLDCDGDQVTLDIPMAVASTGSTSSEDLASDEIDISVYPNPTTDFFQIMNDESVNQIVVSNIIGKKVIEKSHYSGETHQVSQLDKGIYLVRLIDRNSNILGVKRITVD
jgi:hypothetical protein